MPVFRHASCGSEWIYVNLGDTYWLNHNHRKLWIANQIKSAQAIVLNASISGVIDMTTTNTPNDNNTRQNTACIENCSINTHPPFRKPYRKNTQINQQWHLQLCWKFHLIEPKLFGPILLSKRRILPIPWPHLSLSLLLKKKTPNPTVVHFFQPHWHETSCCEKGTQIATLKRASAAQAETISSISCPKISGTCNVDSLCCRYSPHHNASGVLAIYRKVSQWDELRQSPCTSLILLGNQIGFASQRNTSSAANGCWGLLQ